MKMFSMRRVALPLRHCALLLLGWCCTVLAVGEVAMTAQQQHALGIRVAPLSVPTALLSHHFPGEIVVPVGQERIVSAPQPGLVDAVLVAAGQEVRQGQTIAHVSSPELAVLQRDYLQTLTQLGLARGMLERDESLYRDGIIAERRYLAARSAHQELSAVLGQRRQALRLAGMADAAIARLESGGEVGHGISIAAPMSGQVLERMVSAGQQVDPTTPLFRIGKIGPLWVEIHAPVETLGRVKMGTTVRIPHHGAEGRVIAIIRNINKTDQTIHVRAEITHNVERLSPGQFVEVDMMAGGAAGQQFSVLRSAVVRHDGSSYVFAQTPSGFSPRKVSVVGEQSDTAVIAGDLKGDERVAVVGTVAIKAAWIGTGSE